MRRVIAHHNYMLISHLKGWDKTGMFISVGGNLEDHFSIMPTIIGHNKYGHFPKAILNLMHVGRGKNSYVLFLGSSNIIPILSRRIYGVCNFGLGERAEGM